MSNDPRSMQWQSMIYDIYLMNKDVSMNVLRSIKRIIHDLSNG
jgi:hypothetical protein